MGRFHTGKAVGYSAGHNAIEIYPGEISMRGRSTVTPAKGVAKVAPWLARQVCLKIHAQRPPKTIPKVAQLTVTLVFTFL